MALGVAAAVLVSVRHGAGEGATGPVSGTLATSFQSEKGPPIGVSHTSKAATVMPPMAITPAKMTSMPRASGGQGCTGGGLGAGRVKSFVLVVVGVQLSRSA